MFNSYVTNYQRVLESQSVSLPCRQFVAHPSSTRHGKHTKNYWTWRFIVDLLIESMVIFPIYVNVYQRVYLLILRSEGWYNILSLSDPRPAIWWVQWHPDCGHPLSICYVARISTNSFVCKTSTWFTIVGSLQLLRLHYIIPIWSSLISLNTFHVQFSPQISAAVDAWWYPYFFPAVPSGHCAIQNHQTSSRDVSCLSIFLKWRPTDFYPITIWLWLTVCHLKSQFLIGKPSINGPFPMAMLNNQRVFVSFAWE